MRGVLDLRGGESSVRGFRGYADADGACSNRNALPVCVTRHSRQSAAQSSCSTIKDDSAASFESRGTTMRLRIRPHPAICRPRTLTTATSAGAATSSLGPPPPPASSIAASAARLRHAGRQRVLGGHPASATAIACHQSTQQRGDRRNQKGGRITLSQRPSVK